MIPSSGQQLSANRFLGLQMTRTTSSVLNSLSPPHLNSGELGFLFLRCIWDAPSKQIFWDVQLVYLASGKCRDLSWVGRRPIPQIPILTLLSTQGPSRSTSKRCRQPPQPAPWRHCFVQCVLMPCWLHFLPLAAHFVLLPHTGVTWLLREVAS